VIILSENKEGVRLLSRGRRNSFHEGGISLTDPEHFALLITSSDGWTSTVKFIYCSIRTDCGGKKATFSYRI